MEKIVKTVAVDFDGVLNTYQGWKGDNHLYDMRPGADEFLGALSKNFRVVVYTTRAKDVESKSRIQRWLEFYKVNQYVSDVTSSKPRATAYIDDRAIMFNGDFNAVLQNINGFRPHWQINNDKYSQLINKLLGNTVDISLINICNCEYKDGICDHCIAVQVFKEFNNEIVNECCKLLCACCNEGCQLTASDTHTCTISDCTYRCGNTEASCMAYELYGLREEV